MAKKPEVTDFTRDVLGRYVCNSFEEALASTRDGASPFHYIIIGGGTFGGILSSFLANLDPSSPAFDDPFPRYHSRILVLEAGPFLLPEHEQNLPGIGVGVPGPATIAQLQPDPNARRTPAEARNEVWGLPWHSDDGFNGLAYCLGGRSLFWGGWAPRYLTSEMPTGGTYPVKWPQQVVDQLQPGAPLWNEAAHQLGVDDPNDFVNGELHERLREIFAAAVQGTSPVQNFGNMIPIAELPDYVDIVKLGKKPPAGNSLRLDAPYAVQSSTRSGFFPFNKFSSVPLMIAAARKAAGESQKTGDDTVNGSRKQIMVVPKCHVKRLVTRPVGADRGDLRRVVEIETDRGNIPVAHNAAVFFALGAIESARLALESFGGTRSYQHVGKNLMVHLRTNTNFRVNRDATISGQPLFPGFKWDQLEVSAVQLRGRITHPDGTNGHFHLQVVASGVKKGTGNSDIEIFRKIPDIDQVALFQNSKDDEVAIAVRGIGEFSPMNPESGVTLDPELDEFGIRRAFVRINDDRNAQKPAVRNLNEKDSRTLGAMLTATNDVLKLFGQKGARQVFSEPPGGINEEEHIKLDGVGTTYHEAGTLRMGDDPDNSVVDVHQRFHGVTNAYVTDMSVVPTCGSANPLQPGTALTRRLAEHLATPSVDTVPAEGMFLFKDTPTPFWRMTGAAANVVQFGFGELEFRSAKGPFGVYWCLIPTPPDFELSVDWMTSDPDDNSGVFIRFPDPDRAPPKKDFAFTEPGYVATEYGFELQIDNARGGDSPPEGFVDPRFRGTGAFYNEPTQTMQDVAGLGPNQWHTYIIKARGLQFDVDVRVNGGPARPLTSFTFNEANYEPNDVRGNPHRGLPSQPGAERYIGLQLHDKTKLVKYRNIFIKPI